MTLNQMIQIQEEKTYNNRMLSEAQKKQTVIKFIGRKINPKSYPFEIQC